MKRVKVFWNAIPEEFIGEKNNFNITDFLEKNDAKIKSDFKKYISSISDKPLNGISIEDRYRIPSGFSFWWMSTVVEKSFYKSKEITDSLKLIALQLLIKEIEPEELEIHQVDKNNIRKVIIDLSQISSLKKITFEGKIQYSFKLHFLQNTLAILKGFTFIFFRFFSRKIFINGEKNLKNNDKNLLFLSYFAHLKNDSKFHSFQWEYVPKIFDEEGYSIHWIHHYVPSSNYPNPESAIASINQFNDSSDDIHEFLDSYMSKKILLKTLFTFSKIVFKNFSFKSPAKIFRFDNSKANYWSLFSPSWYESTSGIFLAQNIIWYFLFDNMLGGIKKQSKGLFLYEGQGWERAFIFLWHFHEHEKLIGVYHSSFRFWDMRITNFPEINTLRKSNKSTTLFLALNSQMVIDELLSEGISIPIFEVEAQRYNYVLDRKKNTNSNTKKIKRITIFTCLKDESDFLMKDFEKIPKDILKNYEVYVKTHPLYQFEEVDFPSLKFKIDNAELIKVIQKTDIAFSVLSTSASLDTYLMNVPTYVYIRSGEINFSPMKNNLENNFIYSLRDIIKVLNKDNHYSYHGTQFFFLDKDLSRWRKLMKFIND